MKNRFAVTSQVGAMGLCPVKGCVLWLVHKEQVMVRLQGRSSRTFWNEVTV